MVIRHDGQSTRFVAVDGGVQAGELTYTLDGGVLSITHTRVPAEFGGRGVAGELVKAAAEHALAQGLGVNPACSYAARFFEKHAERYGSLVAR